MKEDDQEDLAKASFVESKVLTNLEREANLTRIEYYLPCFPKLHFSAIIFLSCVLLIGFSAYQNGYGWLFLAGLAIFVIFEEMRRIERKNDARWKLLRKQNIPNLLARETGIVPRDE